MKFGRYLKEHSVAEWSRAYINYRVLKKAIGRAVLELEDGAVPSNAGEDEGEEAHGGDARNHGQGRDVELGLPDGGASADDEGEARQSSWSRGASKTSPRSSPLPVGSPLSSPTSHESDRHSTSGGNESEAPTEVPTIVSHTPLFRTFSRSSRASFRTEAVSGSTPLTAQSSRFRRGSLNVSGTLDTLLTPAGDMNPKRWRAGYSPNVPLDELLRILPPACKRFFTVLDRELDKVTTFYGEREAEAVKRFEELSQQWRELADHKKEFQAFRAREMQTPRALAPIIQQLPEAFQLPGSNVVRRKLASRKADHEPGTSTIPEDAVKSLYAHGRPEEYTVAKSKLKLATTEYYRSLGILKSYKVLNTTGFAKALKKFEKSTHIPCSKQYKAARLTQANFESSERLDRLIRETEDAFTSVFEGGDRKKALERLRDSSDRTMHHFASWRAGLLLGLGVPLLVEGLVKSQSATTQAEIPYWPALMQLFGALFLPIIFTLLFFLNILSWHYARINYVLIFELDVRTRMDMHQFLEASGYSYRIPSLLFFILSLFFWAAFSNFWPDDIRPSAYPLAFIVAAFVILLIPLPILHPQARWWSLRSWARVLTAGLLRVEFRDFFLGDELNSLYYCVYNLGFLVCTYKKHWPDDVNMACSTNAALASPFLASVPAFLRLGQSIRRYLDSDGLMIHLLNAGKYTMSIAYFFAYFGWRLHGSHGGYRKAIFILFATLNSTYVASWDILMDWSLLRKGSKNFLLRPELGFKGKNYLYYCAIVTDIILRFSWFWYLLPGPSVQLRGFCLALIEVLRRIMWNAIRVESEHIGNVDGYRVTRNVPLPYMVPGAASSRDQDDAEPDNRTKRQKFFDVFHSLHKSLVRDILPLTTFRLPFRISSDRKRHTLAEHGKMPAGSDKRRSKREVDDSSTEDGAGADSEEDSDEGMRKAVEESEHIAETGKQSEAATGAPRKLD